MLDLNSGYVTRSAHLLPKAGAKGPWAIRQNYTLDSLSMRTADLTKSMQFTTKKPARAVTTV